jgi:hypothetical protein
MKKVQRERNDPFYMFNAKDLSFPSHTNTEW